MAKPVWLEVALNGGAGQAYQPNIPITPEAIIADHLANVAPGDAWMISGLDANIEAITPLALELGANIRVGLEDAPFGCMRSNLELLEATAKVIDREGYCLASAAEVRAAG